MRRVMISQDYLAMLEQRECRGGCGLKFKVLPQSKQQYARSNCESYCKDFRKKDYHPADPIPNTTLEPQLKKELRIVTEQVIEEKTVVKPLPDEQPMTETKPLIEKEKVMLARETPKETKAIKKPKIEVAEPVDLDRKMPEKKPISASVTASNKSVVSKVTKARQAICKICIDDAKKLSANVQSLSSKMELVYLYNTYREFSEDEKPFLEAVSLKAEEFKKWQQVYSTIYERLTVKEWVLKYPVDDLYGLCNQIDKDHSEEKIKSIVEEKLFGNYKLAIDHSDKALNNLLSFYEKVSFELLDDQSLDSTYTLVKRLYNRFRSQIDKKRKK
jgi:hypothetical protein